MSMNPKVHLDWRVFQKIMHWCRKAGSYEVSGLGNVVYDPKENVFFVNEVYLLEQENTGTSTDINEAAIGKLMFEHHKSKIKGDLKFWWHSHADMNVFWSSTDMATIQQLGGEGSILATVFNKKEEMRSAFYMTNPMSVFVDELPTVVLQEFGDKEVEKALAKIGLQLRQGKMPDFRWLVEPVLSEEDKEEWDNEYDKKVKVKKSIVFPNSLMGHGFSHTPLHGIDDDDDDFISRMLSETSQGVPDFNKPNKYGLTPDEMDDLYDDIEQFIESFPGSTREEVIEMFEGEYPFISEIVHPNFKGLSDG